MFVITDNFRFSWLKFAKLADNMYDSGYGIAEVKRDIRIMGDKWWLERAEYDGSEWWEYKEYPQIDNTTLQEPMLNDIFDSWWMDARKKEAEQKAKEEEDKMEDARLEALDPGDIT